MNISRRGFIFGSTAAVAFASRSADKVGLRPLKAGEKRRAAMIGCGIQMRTALLPSFLGKAPGTKKVPSFVDVVAVCDCDKARREQARGAVNKAYKNSNCKAVADFREILKDPSIDMVCIATPDHWHAYISVEAMKHGKDVYCEKPLTFSIDEAKKVMAAQKKYGRVFQTGSMQRSWDVFRTAAMVVRNGIVGDIKYVDANYGRGGQKLGGPSHPFRFWDNPENAAKESEGYALLGEKGWDMWLGPAKWRPYSNQLAPKGVNRFYPMFWRFDDDIGSGYNGDWGAHHLDIAQWGLDMDDSGPYRIVCSDEPHSKNLFHGGRRQYGMKMLFKSKKDGSDIELYHGPFGTWGTVFYGTDGIVAVNRGKIAVWKGTGAVKPDAGIRKLVAECKFMPEKIVAASVGKDYGTDATAKKDDRLARTLDVINKRFSLDTAPVQLYKSSNQILNFVECVETRKPTISPAEVGARGAALCLLCNMSYQYDTGFEWDPAKMEIAGGNEKGISIRREVYRNGWDVVV